MWKFRIILLNIIFLDIAMFTTLVVLFCLPQSLLSTLAYEYIFALFV